MKIQSHQRQTRDLGQHAMKCRVPLQRLLWMAGPVTAPQRQHSQLRALGYRCSKWKEDRGLSPASVFPSLLLAGFCFPGQCRLPRLRGAGSPSGGLWLHRPLPAAWLKAAGPRALSGEPWNGGAVRMLSHHWRFHTAVAAYLEPVSALENLPWQLIQTATANGNRWTLLPWCFVDVGSTATNRCFIIFPYMVKAP